MKKFILTLATALLSAVALFAGAPKINDVEIYVRLLPDGTGIFQEKWDTQVSGSVTEMYLPRQNLGDIEIKDFSVTDEKGKVFQTVDPWNTEWDRTTKTHKCGLNYTSDGKELCWGVGDDGHRIYTLNYKMTNVVKSADDYDYFHVQIVNDGISNPPEHVLATIEVVNDKGSRVQLDTIKCRIWGFGYEGYIWAEEEDGTICLESEGAFTQESSMIALIRFDKGMFHSSSVVAGPFQDHLDKALEGNTYFKGEEGSSSSDDLTPKEKVTLWAILAMIAAAIFGSKKMKPSTKNRSKSVLGFKSPEETPWSREIPFDGDIIRTDTVMSDLCLAGKNNTQYVAQALIIRMIYKGFLNVTKDANGNDRFTFHKDLQKGELGQVGSLLFSLMKEAAGEDGILDSGEFSKWARRNSSKFGTWSVGIIAGGAALLRKDGYRMSASKYTEEGQKKAQQAYGFYRFLKDFTNMKDKVAMEAVLWQDYLTFGALFGIADQVAKELKEINPTLYEVTSRTESGRMYDMYSLLRCTEVLSKSVSTSAAAYAARTTSSSTSFGGGGGRSSFGGGGGFSGGGHGGGFR